MKSSSAYQHQTNGNGQSLLRVLPKPVESGTVLTGVRKKVFWDRYSMKAEDGSPMEQYPEQMWRRVARAIARVEKTQTKRQEWEEKFYKTMEGFKFVPAGRILSGAGTGYEVTYYNCFVIPSPRDSRDGILEALKQLVEIQARSGGVGLNLSALRPRGARVKKVNGTSSGPITWAGLYSYATHDVVQQGGTRRGATMLMLWDWHPDVEEFITVKEDLTKIHGANLSVCISDAFMKAVKKDGDWQLVFPDLDDPEYDEKWDGDINAWRAMGKKVKVYKTVKARYLWDLICTAAWKSAEPGLHFLERSNKWSNTWYFENLLSTNPCGEQPLPEWGVCNLGAMNLAAYVNESGEFDYGNFGKDVQVAMRFLDNVIDETYYFFPQNEKVAKAVRRTGLGIMGLGDALIKMKIPYGSEESLLSVEKIMQTLAHNAYEASSDIAAEKGSFPKFDKAKYLQGHFIKKLPKRLREKIKKQGIRNAVLLTIAPTGTTSLLSGASSGCEPVYEFELVRRDRMGEHKIMHPLYEEWREQNPGLPKPDYFVSANDLTPKEHALVQAVCQKYIDASISKTVNAPNHHTVEQVKELYTMAYDLGMKGVTYMRDGSREGVLSRKKEDKKGEDPKPQVQAGPVQALVARPDKVTGTTYRVMTPIGSIFITINEDEKGNPFEVFINGGKGGSDIAAMTEALGRSISTILRMNAAASPKTRLTEVIDQLSGIGGRRSVGFGVNKVHSLPDAVAQALRRHLNASRKLQKIEEMSESNGQYSPNSNLQAGAVMAAHNPDPTPAPAAVENSAQVNLPSVDICPECGAVALVHEEGCAKCYACGHAEC